MARKRVIVALSGGVDSAVAALLLGDAGHDVQCLHMTNWEDDGYCDSARDFQDARAVCLALGVPLHRVSFAREYRDQVFAQFLDEHRAGRTPNPDVLCNREIKFGEMRRHAERLGADAIATGHYARLARSGDGTPRLSKAVDSSKDQSYFLHAVRPADFERVLFPLGELAKSEVRAIARRARLPVAAKKDSTGICFIGERPFAEFLAGYVPPSPGPIVDVDGRELGRHPGLAYYTLGQRGGIGLGGTPGAAEAPWYVAAKDTRRNALVIVQGHDHPLLYQDTLAAAGMHWLGAPPRGWDSGAPVRCTAKVRYRQPDQPCTAVPTEDGGIEVSFDQPQRTPTPGQYVVLYGGDACLGGATIERAWNRVGDAAASRDTLRAAV
ncbi:MAG TPA: tRNA 2-thiouridine(34) synthase MnmA [Gammaproteobacteria bacterium]|nr:tRNA 2-thiouridine(34) synthase MnmA [Gammaproteobacteria bacterium]